MLHTDYEVIPAGSTDFELKGLGHGTIGDVLGNLILVPLDESTGAVTLKDGIAGPVYTLIVAVVGSAGFLLEIVPNTLIMSRKSQNGAWFITTGVDILVIAAGCRFKGGE